MMRFLFISAPFLLAACASDHPDPPAPAPGGMSVASGLRSNEEDVRILSLLKLKDEEEVRIGRVAQRRAQGTAARALADMLVEDHGGHASEVGILAAQMGLGLWDEDQVRRGRERPGVSDRQPASDMVGMLEGTEIERFDQEFASATIKGHSDLIGTLEEARSRLGSATVRALIDRTLPTLRRHADLARTIPRR